MKKLLNRMFNKPKRMSQSELLSKFEMVVDSFTGAEENLLTKETLLLSYQGANKVRTVNTHFGEMKLERINWKSLVRKQEVEALNHKNQNLFNALESYLISSLEDYGLNLKKVKNEIDGEKFNIEVDFKQNFRNDDFFNDLKELSQKVEELDGSLKLYKSKKVDCGIWKLILSVDKNIQPTRTETELVGEA